MATFAACTKPRTGTVQGDVYLLMQNGDVKHGAGNTVLLLGPADSVRATRARVCRSFGDQRLAATRRGDTLSADTTLLRLTVDTALARLTVASSKTGINAHYRFDRVPAGRYILWAETRIGDNPYTWWAPIVVGGDSVSVDLDNSTEGRAALYCGPERESLTQVLLRVQDSVVTALVGTKQQTTRLGWLRCMTQARKRFGANDREKFGPGWGTDSALGEGALIDARYECWTKFPVDGAWAKQQNP
jgi:hypothetical protein